MVKPIEIKEIKELTESQKAFLEYCRKLGWGTIEKVEVKNGEPVYAVRVIEGQKFGN